MKDLAGLLEWATPRQQEYIEAMIRCGSYRAAAKELDVTHNAIHKSIKSLKKRAAKQGYAPLHDMTHTAPDTHIVKGVSTLYGVDGMVKQQWVKTDLNKDLLRESLEAVIEDLKGDIAKCDPKPDELELTDEALTAYVIGDGHIGMSVRNHHNMGAGSWDLREAEMATISTINRLIRLSGGTDIGLLVDVGDFAHADNMLNISQSGHFHKIDGDFKDMITTCVRIYRQAIDMMLTHHRDVVVMMVRGNHNSNVSLSIGAMLEVFYENEPRVTVLDNRHKFITYEYGKNLFAGHHGDKMKVDQAYQFLTKTFAESWGRTKHRHCFMGHIHHQTSKEVGGMLFETYNTIAPPDEWHSHSGYGAKRSMTSIVFNKDHGEIQRHKISVG